MLGERVSRHPRTGRTPPSVSPRAGQILVVTFTNAATRELYDRIRTRVREALTAFEEESSEDEVLAALVLASPDRAESRDRLKAALRDFDDAAIFTIHGLCQRVLVARAGTGDLDGLTLVPMEHDRGPAGVL